MSTNDRLRAATTLSALAVCGGFALAQTPQLDAERLRREGVERADAEARAHGFEQQRQQQARERQEEERRRSQSSASTGGGYAPSPSGGTSAGPGGRVPDMRALGKEMLRLPPLPIERNVLLGSWRLEGGGPKRGVAEFALTGKGATPGMGELLGMMKDLESGKTVCDVSFSGGISFTPTTYSSGGVAGMAGGPIAYRSRDKQVIVAIPADSRANPMPFEIKGPNRIVWGSCALVRVLTAAANPPATATTAPGSARMVAAPARSAAPMAKAADSAGAVVDGAAFRCSDGSLLHVSFCAGDEAHATCKLAELHLPGQMGKLVPRAAIAARVKGCEVGGIRYGADDKPMFVR